MMFRRMPIVARLALAVLLGLGCGTSAAQADGRDEIVVGFIVSATGSAASLGVHYRNAAQLFPAEIGGKKVRAIVRDDGSDSSQALNIARQLVVEEKVDALIGPTLTTSTLAAIQFINDAKVPEFPTSPIGLDLTKYPYTFAILPTADVMMAGVVDDMVARGVKKVGYIGFADSYGDQIRDSITKGFDKHGIGIVSEQRYGRTDTSIQAQILRLMASKPDAIVVGAAGTQATLPGITLRERGYKGLVYNTYGSVTPDFLRVGGAGVEGEIAPTGPAGVFDQLPASHPARDISKDFMTRYLAAFGEANRNAFAGYSYDAFLLFESAAKVALKTAQPGTQAFRDAVRAAAETQPALVGTEGLIKMTPDDHYGRDGSAAVLVQVVDGAWKLVSK